MTKYDISKWGLPREYTACPSCGQQYGYNNKLVCLNCEECSTCCPCKAEEKDLKPSRVAIPIILGEE